MARSAQGGTVAIELGDDELLGAHLLARMNGVDNRDRMGFNGVLASSLRRGIADQLAAAGIAWPPTPDALELADRVGSAVASDGPRESGERSAHTAVAAGDPEIAATGRARRLPQGLARDAALYAALAVVLTLVLIGGYALHWSWTGFTANNQLWDWMELLLLPVALATFPLWLGFSRYMSAARRRALGGAVIVFAVFVVVGYVNPLRWTGFRGQTLWDWLTLIILPVSIVTVRVWPQSGRDLHRTHVLGATVVCAALVATIVGGYWAGWRWTGYQGNTLWDWLTLVLAPVALTTVLVPSLARRLAGGVDERAARDRERAAHELALRAARERLAQRPSGRGLRDDG